MRKICTGCGRKRLLKFFHRHPHGQYGRRSKCVDCAAVYRKEYSSRPEVKKRHRESAAAWRKKHPIKAKRIHRKAWHKNKHKYNKRRNEMYRNDPAFKEKKLASERRYLQSGRRHFVRRRRQKEKAEELRRKVKEWREKNPEKKRAFYKRYRANIQNPREREQRRNLDDVYVIKVIKKQLDYKIHTKDIPKELIKLERLRLLTKRQLKPFL